MLECIPPARSAKRCYEFLSRGVAIVRIAGESLLNGAVHPRGEIRAQRKHAGRGFCKALNKSFLAGERRLTCQHFVKDTAETVRIAPAVNLSVTEELLGAHIRRSAGSSHACAGELTHPCQVNHPCYSEIREDGVTRGKENIFRLDVPVNYALRVSIGECVCRVSSDTACCFG